MFPPNQGPEISFGQEDPDDSDNRPDEEPNQLQDFGTSNELLAAFNWHTSRNKGKDKVVESAEQSGQSRKRNSSTSSTPPIPYHSGGNEHEKRIIHRDIERQRRLEMSTLFSRLRSLLPVDYIKGKRSMSDHVEGSVRYVNQLKDIIKDLNERRDKQLLTASSSTDYMDIGVDEGNSTSSSSNSDFNVVIHPIGDGIQLHISVHVNNEAFALSKALKVLLEEGMSITTCSCTRLNENFIHSIHCQISEDNPNVEINLPRLYQRIRNIVCSSM